MIRYIKIAEGNQRHDPFSFFVEVSESGVTTVMPKASLACRQYPDAAVETKYCQRGKTEQGN